MPRLPQVGSDNNTWGEVLNDFLKVSHNEDGTLKESSTTSNYLKAFNLILKTYNSNWSLKGFLKTSDQSISSSSNDIYIPTENGNYTNFIGSDSNSITVTDYTKQIISYTGSYFKVSYLGTQLTQTLVDSINTTTSDDQKIDYSNLKNIPAPEGTTTTVVNGLSKTETKFKIKVTPTDSGTISNINLSIPALKYNKKWAYVFCSDDAYLGIYQLIQKWINGRYVETGYYTSNPTLNWHDSMTRVSGETNQTPLCYTDGCGNNIPFRVEMAFLTANSSGVDLHKAATPQNFTQIQYSEMQSFLDWFGSFTNHEYGGISDAIRSLTLNEENIYNHVGRYPTIMTRPNGDNTYISAAKILDYFIALTTESSSTFTHFKDDTMDLDKIIAYRKLYSFDVDNASTIISDIQTKLASMTDSYAPLVYHFTHKISCAGTATSYSSIKSAFQTIHSTWGAGGDDSVLFASFEEIMQYANLRRKTSIVRTVVGSTVVFDVTIPEISNFSWKEMSFLVNGVSSLSSATIEVLGEAYGLSKGVNNSKILINIDYNKKSLELAEKYVALAETNATSAIVSEYKYDAQFFTNRLRSEFKTYYQGRIDALQSGPTLNSISINNGDTSTSSLSSSITLNFTGSITEYMIGEVSDLSSSSWVTYVSNPISYTLSSGNGTKTVYVKIRNGSGESSIVSDSIEYSYTALSLDTVTIDSGNSTTTSQTVAIVLGVTGSATHYKVGEVSDLNSSSWVTYSSTFNYTFSSNTSELKTVYVQIKNSTETSSILSDTITYNIPVVPTLSLDSVVIDSGNSSTTNSTVSVAITYSNSTPTYYKIGEVSDLSSSSWVAFSSSPISYNFSSTGVKTIYVQIKDGTTTSSILSDSITYSAPAGKKMKFFVYGFGTGTMAQGTVGSDTWNYGKITSSTSYTLKDTTNTSYCSVIHVITTSLGSATAVTLPSGTVYDDVFALNTGTGLQWYMSTADYNNTSKVRFSGLTAGKTLNFKLFATENSANNRSARYRIVGESATSYQNLNSAGNLSTVLSYSGVIVPSSGIVDVEWAAVSPAVRAFLQIIEIEEA